MGNRPLATLVDRLRTLLAGSSPTVRADGDLLERFARHGDQEAFATLVRRYAPLVLGVCRRVLGDPHRAEDAFQATFLILARKAPGLHRDRPLAGWLSTVAYRAALRVRANDARRQRLERSVMGQRSEAVPAEASRADVDPLLDAELQRLPEKYRLPLVLCHLQAATHEEAAAQLACPVGTIRSRLSRGRDLLRVRLTRRGLTLTSAGLAVLLAESAWAVEPSAALLRATLYPIVSQEVGRIAREVMRIMLIQKLKWSIVGVGVFLALGTAVALHQAPGATPLEPEKTPPAAAKETAVDATAVGTIRLPLLDVPTATRASLGDHGASPRLSLGQVPRGSGAAAAKSRLEGNLELLPPRAGVPTAVVLDALLRADHVDQSGPNSLSRRENVFTLVVDEWDSNYEYRRNIPEQQTQIVNLGDLAAGDYELRLVVRRFTRKSPDGEVFFHCQGKKSAVVKFSVAAADAAADKAGAPKLDADALKPLELAAGEADRLWQRPEATAYGPWVGDFAPDKPAEPLGLRVGTFDPERWRQGWPKAAGVAELVKMLPDLRAPQATELVYAFVAGPVMPELHMRTSLREIEWKGRTAVLRIDAWYDGGPNDHNVPVCPVLLAPLTLPMQKDKPGSAVSGEYKVTVEWTLLFAERWTAPHKVMGADQKWAADFLAGVRARSEAKLVVE